MRILNKKFIKNIILIEKVKIVNFLAEFKFAPNLAKLFI